MDYSTFSFACMLNKSATLVSLLAFPFPLLVVLVGVHERVNVNVGVGVVVIGPPAFKNSPPHATYWPQVFLQL